MARSRFGVALSAAVVVVAGGALHLAARFGIAAGADSDLLFANFIPQFGLTGGRPPSTVDQIESVTVMNQSAGQSVRVTGVSVQKTGDVGAVNPWRVGPGEDCAGATIVPQGYCVVTLSFHPEAIPLDTEITGELDLALSDNTVFAQRVSTTSEPADEEPGMSPRQIDYGNVTLGATTAPQTVTLSADGGHEMVMSIRTVPQPRQPDAATDYRTATDTCTGTTFGPFVGGCTISATATPAAAGNRPAFLDIAVCDPDTFPLSDPGNDTGNQVPPPAVPPGQELICGQTTDPPGPILAKHLLVTLTTNGVPQPSQTFTPTLTTFPTVAPAGRTTMVTGTGFPDNTKVTLALVPLGTPATTDLATVPGSISVTTNGIGGFTNQPVLVLPHTPPGQYEIMAATATVGLLVAPGTEEPPKFVSRH